MERRSLMRLEAPKAKDSSALRFPTRAQGLPFHPERVE